MKSIVREILVLVLAILLKQYWYWCQQYFITEVLLLVLTIVFMSTFNIPHSG